MANKATIQLTLAQILEGKRAGRPQIVGLMEVIPLFPQDETHKDRHFAIPTKHMLLGDSYGYGNITVKNSDPVLPLVVPTNVSWVTGKKVQDHALTKAGLLAPGEEESYYTAGCVESSQPGHYTAGEYEFQILPATLRCFDETFANNKSFQKFWKSIGTLNQDIGAVERDSGHLRLLFDKFKNELETFVAEFENCEGQIGAIILINGRVTGIEVAPSAEYWTAVWGKLIRYCYGPEALLVARKLGKTGLDSAVSARPRLDIESCNSLEDIKAGLENVRKQEAERAKSSIFGDLNIVLDLKSDKSINVNDPDFGDVVYNMTSSYNDYVGQVVLDDEYAVYASLVNQALAPRRPMRSKFDF